jgi:hypothetical protein
LTPPQESITITFCQSQEHRGVAGSRSQPLGRFAPAALCYNADSDGGDRRDAHYREFRAWLRVKDAEYGKTDVWFR